MFAVSFIFRPGAYDGEFRRLDAATRAIAEATKGFIGSEIWWSDDRAACDAACYWEYRRQLAAFARAILHRAAKARFDRWYDRYQVVGTEVRGAYGDGRLPNIASPISKFRRPPAVREA